MRLCRWRFESSIIFRDNDSEREVLIALFEVPALALAAVIDVFFEFFADFEKRQFLFVDVDDFARAGIAAFVSAVVAIDEGTKSTNFDAIIAHQGFNHGIENRVHDGFGFHSRDSRLFGDHIDQVGFRHFRTQGIEIRYILWAAQAHFQRNQRLRGVTDSVFAGRRRPVMPDSFERFVVSVQRQMNHFL